MKTKFILTTFTQIKKALQEGDEVFIGSFQIYTQNIIPSDKLVLENGNRLVQVGVERQGISFDVSEFDIQYELDAYKLLLTESKTQSGGNACFVFFQYSEPSKWYPHCTGCGEEITIERYVSNGSFCCSCATPSYYERMEYDAMYYELNKTQSPSWCEFPKEY
jgi:hypothetical protein